MKSIDDYAISYETIIRNANDCKRYGADGTADADKYRHLLCSYGHLHDCINENGIDAIKDAKNKFDENCKYISDNLSDAISKLCKTYPNLSKVNESLPQTTIHGINMIMDEIRSQMQS